MINGKQEEYDLCTSPSRASRHYEWTPVGTVAGECRWPCALLCPALYQVLL